MRLRQERIDKQWRDLHREHVEQHERDVLKEQERNAVSLKDQQFAVSLGLPPELPDYTIGILKRTMALAKLEPSRPKVNQYDSRGGPPTALHSCNVRR